MEVCNRKKRSRVMKDVTAEGKERESLKLSLSVKEYISLRIFVFYNAV